MSAAKGLTIELTELRKTSGILSKRIALGEDGKPKADGSGCRLIVGMAHRKRMNGGKLAGVLAGYLNGMDSKTALALGRMKNDAPDKSRVVSKKRLADYNDGIPTITRTLDNFAFTAGPGWALIDHDTKGMPAPVLGKLAKLGGPEAALRHLIPGYDSAARVARASTSSGLSHAGTGEQFPGSGGRHDYILLADQRDAPRFLRVLHRRAWRAGLGWMLVGTAGQILERSIVDTSVGSPERLVFEGAPIVVAPLVQDTSKRKAMASSAAAPLDSSKAVPDLTAVEEADYQRLVAAERTRLRPAAKSEQKRWIAREGAKLGPDGERIVKAALARRILSGAWSLQFDDDELGAVTVDAIMADPGKYDGETLADPIDGIEYGPGKAKLFLNDDGTIVINSFAHGGRIFRLLHSAASARAAIEKAGKEAGKIYIKVILAADINASEEDQLLELVRDITGIGKMPLKSDLKRARGEAARERAKERAESCAAPGPHDGWEWELASAVARLNERYFVAGIGGSVRIAKTVHDYSRGRDRLVFMRDSDMRLRYSHIHLKVGVNQRGYDIVKGLGEAWINHNQRRTYDGIEMIPDGPCPPDVYNLWRGWGAEPKAGSWSTLEAHLREVICSGRADYYEWLIGWMAYCVQHPGRQAEVAVVLRGRKGIGKGMLGQMLIRMFRDHHLHITHSKHLVGHFNAHLVDTLFLFVDEAFWAGDKQGEGTLKALITERTLMIEPKGVDSFQMPNRLKILMASNNDWVVPATADERRYFVLDVPDARKGDTGYFKRLVAVIEGEELPACLDYLLKLDLSDFDHRNPPHTEGLNKQKLIGGDSLQKFWMDCLTTGTIVNAEVGDDWPRLVRCADLHNAYIEHAHAHGDRHPLTAEQLAIRLRKLCPDDQLKVTRPWAGGGPTARPRLFALQSLDLHRAAFLKAMGIDSHAWPQVEPQS